MLVYPQLASGALSQYPVRRRQQSRTIVNSMADGGWVKLTDPGAGTIEWDLSYTGLSDGELLSLRQFFLATEGSLNGFTFLDPTGNLLAWTDELTNAAWTAMPGLVLQSGIADPVGGSKAWRVANSGGGPESLSQTLNAPAVYTYCFSVWLRAAQPLSATVAVGSQSANCPVEDKWTGISVCGSGDPNGLSVAFGITVQGGAAIELYGPQVGAQASPSVYQPSTRGGVYPEARLQTNGFSFMTLAPNNHSARVKVLYAEHL